MAAKKPTTAINFNLDGWTYLDYNAFFEAMQAGDLITAGELALDVILSWEYPVSLSGPNPFGELSMAEGGEALRSIMHTLAEFSKSVDISDVEVNLTKFKMSDFAAFQTALREKDLTTVQNYLRRAVGQEPSSEPLSVVDGVKFMRGYLEAQKALFRG